ncbi:MAG: hypothetical protein P0Y56_11775 [Candidatus Andeanibacterium colombiense]|uniref:Uncharacterized protein n=1 Tax=Candidatus Andeanibacterium colombiense TaxID=3121345 RepID=A0AAJ5X4Y4_9SPHN|nr:MAG: hypothetical protein P0Y56_11775 [Sphingomonadaceae bacterium]
MKRRLWLWVVAAAFTLPAITLTADLADGRTHVLWDRPVAMWTEPALFAVTAVVALGCIAVGAVFWLASIGDWNELWLPPRLRGKPLILLASITLLTAGAICFSVDVLSGDLRVRRLGHVTADGTPLRFAWVALCCLVGWVFVAVGWYAIWHIWTGPSRPRWRPARRT